MKMKLLNESLRFEFIKLDMCKHAYAAHLLAHAFLQTDQGRSQGKGGNSSPKPKKLLEKNSVISEGSIFSNKFSQKIKNKN